MKTGLVLEGGSMRGIFTVGVMDVFMENNIEFDGLIGVSAGAAFGCNYKSRQPGRAVRYNVKYRDDKRYCSFKSLRETGDIFNVDFCYRQIPYELDPIDFDTYEQNPMEFYVVATDMETGEPAYKMLPKLDETGMLYIRSSASIPGLSTPVEVDGHKYSDGGTADSIPLQYFESIGYDRNVVILTQPFGFVKKQSKLFQLLKMRLKAYPALIKALKDRPAMYNKELEYIFEKEKRGEIIVIRPPEKIKLKTGASEKEYMDVYNLGRKCGEIYLDRVKEFVRK